MFKNLPFISLVCSNEKENKNKYYIISVEEDGADGKYKVVYKYGRLGKLPRIIVKPCSVLEEAYKSYISKLNELKRKEYKEVDVSEIIMSDGSFIR